MDTLIYLYMSYFAQSILNKYVNKDDDLLNSFFYVIHARTHVVGGVGSVTKLQAKNVNKL